jgi:FMN-dependent NADH-azoreductase
LLEGKKVYVFAARGGLYAGTARDTQLDAVRAQFPRADRLADVDFVYAEGLGRERNRSRAGHRSAHADIERLTDPA